MSSSAVTLQCPACGGVFLTLQQGTGGAEICPHCSMSAPRGRYRSIETQSSPGARAALPPRRPETAPGTTSQPVPVLTASMIPEVVPAERPVSAPTTLPPVRPGSAAEPVHSMPPPAPTAVVSGLSMQLPAGAGVPDPTAVASERVPVPHVPAGEVPLPSRVLQTLPTPTSSVPANQSAQQQVASPFSVATGLPNGPAPDPAGISEAPQPLPPVQPPYPQQYTTAPAAPSPAQLPVAYPPVPAPPPQVDPAAVAKASPAQLWEAAMLQHHHQQAREASITPTGRELFPTGAVPTFQPPPPPTQLPTPSGPVTFGPLTPPASAEPPLVAQESALPAGAAPTPPGLEPPAPPSSQPGGLPSPRPGGTALPTARSAPPVVPLYAYGVPPASPLAEPLPPPQIGFVPAPQTELPGNQAEGPVPPATSPFGMATASSPADASSLPRPSASTEPIPPPTPEFIAALEQARAQETERGQEFFNAAEPPAGSDIFASTEPPAISGDPPRAFIPGPPTQGTSLLLGESTAAELHLPKPQDAQDIALAASKVMRNSGRATASPAPAPAAPRRKIGPWMAGLILGSLALGAGLHFLKDGMPALLGTQRGATTPAQASNTSVPVPPPAPSPQVPASNTVEATPSPVPNPSQGAKQAALNSTLPNTADSTPASTAPAPSAPVPAPTSLPVPPMPPAPAQEEVRRAMPSNPETLSISTEDPLPAIAAKLMFGFDSASTPEERAKWIAEPDKHSAAMEHLIRLRGGRLNTREVEPLSLQGSGPVQALPSGEMVTLFRVNSPASRGGAILRLHARDGQFLIDWPLFAQTYDNAFDRFVATNRAIPGKAEWYTVLCSLMGGPDAKNATREPHLRLKVQGSLAETGVTEAWVEKLSPAGRYLSGMLAPNRVYLVELQFGASDAGSRRLMVLDCAATRGQAAQANANK